MYDDYISNLGWNLEEETRVISTYFCPRQFRVSLLGKESAWGSRGSAQLIKVMSLTSKFEYRTIL